jgi:DNA-binding CsgD family transcriptional regulator
MAQPEPQIVLTDRQLVILAYIAEGLESEQVGRVMFLSLDTVKTHVHKLYRKLGASNRAHAVAIAYECGILPAAKKMIGESR